MTRTELTMNSYKKDLDKLKARQERADAKYVKKLATAEKYGVADWSNEQYREWVSTVETTDTGYIVNTTDQKKNGAWWDLLMVENELEEISKNIERAEARYAKSLSAYEQELEAIAINEEDNERSSIANKIYKNELSRAEIIELQNQMREEWAKVGITIEKFYGSGFEGTTPDGKPFDLYINSGITERSWHCYTLRIDHETWFTSGTIQSCYRAIKNH